jgi:predicted amidohydrolase YtcJ
MFLILCLSLALMAQGEPAGLIIHGARIYTGTPGERPVSSLAVRDGKIFAVGDDLSRYAGPSTRRIDAHGATIIPGFIDSHAHMLGLGENLESPDFRYTRTVEDVAKVVKNAAASRAPGEWIVGYNWDQTNWGGQFPTEQALSAAVPDHPVYLTRVDGHASWINRKALEIAGISANTPDPPGGKILRTPAGAPSGVLIDTAQGLVERKIPPATDEQIRRRLERAARECARLGITTVHDAGVGTRELSAYRALIREGRLPIRVYAMIGGAGSLWTEYLKRGPETGERLTVRSIKLMADGAMGSRGAAFQEPYSDDPGNTGLLMLTRPQIERIAKEAAAHGFQVNTHAIGDRAIHTVLEAYGAVLGGHNDRRFRIEHAQCVAPPDFELFSKYSVIASMQATHATSDMRWAAARVGPERVKGCYAWRSFLSLGVPVPNGSDFPVEEPNPLWGFYAAITCQDREGNPKDGWFPDQRMTREEALRSWTAVGAYAAFEENIKGTLAPGKLADFVMLSDDIMTVPAAHILKTRVLMTVSGGKIVHEAAR